MTVAHSPSSRTETPSLLIVPTTVPYGSSQGLGWFTFSLGTLTRFPARIFAMSTGTPLAITKFIGRTSRLTLSQTRSTRAFFSVRFYAFHKNRQSLPNVQGDFTLGRELVTPRRKIRRGHHSQFNMPFCSSSSGHCKTLHFMKSLAQPSSDGALGVA